MNSIGPRASLVFPAADIRHPLAYRYYRRTINPRPLGSNWSDSCSVVVVPKNLRLKSAEMLSYVRGTQTVCSTIEDLRLGRTFDVVLLASYLIHTGDPGLARRLLDTCRVHAGPSGRVIIQRRPQETPDQLSREATIGAGGVARVVSSAFIGGEVWQAQVQYVFPDATWTQTFTYRPLSYQKFEDELSAAGLHLDRYLTADRSWAECSSPTPGLSPPTA